MSPHGSWSQKPCLVLKSNLPNPLPSFDDQATPWATRSLKPLASTEKRLPYDPRSDPHSWRAPAQPQKNIDLDKVEKHLPEMTLRRWEHPIALNVFNRSWPSCRSYLVSFYQCP
jgi:hypothetical protein